MTRTEEEGPFRQNLTQWPRAIAVQQRLQNLSRHPVIFKLPC